MPVTYNLLLQLRINRWVAAMGGLLIVFGKFRFAFHLNTNFHNLNFSRQRSADTIKIRPNGAYADLVFYLGTFVPIEILRL